ncbi:MAG: hypothetical protein E6J72_16720 [Deltaproteobacteria bacterium]|nr:MAG: hypothetical protein E6J72_16720 [Deltaproteobacteria bacterium]
MATSTNVRRHTRGVHRTVSALLALATVAAAACGAAAHGTSAAAKRAPAQAQPAPRATPSPSPAPRRVRSPATHATPAPSPAAVRHAPRAAAPRAEEPLEGFGSATKGGAGGREVWVTEASVERLRDAIHDINETGDAVLRFDVATPIMITRPLPYFTAPHVTIDGHGATLDGSALTHDVALLDIRTHDVIVRNLRVRNGYDNLRAQGPDAHDIVFTHVSSTGARDDGLSVAYEAHDVTAQYLFLAGNTRSIFCKEGGTNLSVHHSWIQKGWIRNPIVSGPARADVRNVIVEDWGEWGARFENGATGNVVGSLFSLSDYARQRGGKADSALRAISGASVYLAGNVFRGARPPNFRGAPNPFAAAPITTAPVEQMEERVRAAAGCLPRDAIDDRYIGLRAGWEVGRETPLRLDD